jgi:hypothetical protein
MYLSELRLWNFRKYGKDGTVQSTLFDFMQGGAVGDNGGCWLLL